MALWFPAVLSLFLADGNPAAPRLAVLDVSSPPSLVGLASWITHEVLDEAQGQGYAVLPPESVQASLGDALYDEVRRCGPQVGCAVGGLTRLGADRAVVGTLERDDKSYLVRLWLFSLKEGRVLAEVDLPVLIASRRLARDVADAVPALLEGRPQGQGTLEVTSAGPPATLSVDGRPVGETPVRVGLKAGRHELRAEKAGYLPERRFLDVELGAITREEVRLLRAPALAEGQGGAGAVPAEGPRGPADGGWPGP